MNCDGWLSAISAASGPVIRYKPRRSSTRHAYAMAGKRSEALKILDEFQALSKQRYVTPYVRALVYTGLGEKDQALAWLGRAYEEQESRLIFLKVNATFDGLRADPRFVDLMRRMGFSP